MVVMYRLWKNVPFLVRAAGIIARAMAGKLVVLAMIPIPVVIWFLSEDEKRFSFELVAFYGSVCQYF